MLRCTLRFLLAPAAALIAIGLISPNISAQSSKNKSQGQGQSQNGNSNSSQSQNGGGGNADGGGGSAGIESYTLAYNGLRGDSVKIAGRISAAIGTGSKIIILDKQTLDDLVGLQVATLEAESLKNELCAFRPPRQGPGGGQAPAGGGGGGSLLGDVSSIISSTASLVQALTPDSTSNNADIKIADEFLVAEEIAAIQRKHSDIEVIWPKNYLQLPSFDIANAPDQDGCSAVPSTGFIDVYRRLIAAYSNAQMWIQSNVLSADDKAALKSTLSRVDSFRNQLESSKKSSASQQQNNAGAPNGPGGNGVPARPAGNAADQVDSSSSQPSETTSPLLRFVRVGAFLTATVNPCTKTDANCFFLYLRMGQASGGTLVKKSFFHPTYYYYSGGAVGSFALIRVADANVVKTGTVTTSTSYMREKTFKKLFGTSRRYDAATDKTMDQNSAGNDEY